MCLPASKKYKHARKGKKGKKTQGGVFDRQKGCQKNCFGNALIFVFDYFSKTSPNRKKWHPKSEKRILQISQLIFLDAAGWSNILFFVVLVCKMKDVPLLWNKAEHD